jgi:hypothetical protein
MGLGLWCLTPLSTIFRLYRGGQTCWTSPYTNNINKIRVPLQTTEGKEHRFYAEIVTDIKTWSPERKDI